MNRDETYFENGQVVRTAKFDVSWIDVRAKRDQLLSESDWRAVKDRTMGQDWKNYRTALRDLPQDHIEANDAADNWPEAPE